MTPKVWNKHDFHPHNNIVFCGRGSIYGNPFKIGDIWKGEPMTRDTVCDRFEQEILPKLDVRELKGKHLLCYCAPQRCHCDAILRKANG